MTTKEPQYHLWSNPSNNRENVERFKDAVAALKLTSKELADRRKLAAERIKPFKTGALGGKK